MALIQRPPNDLTRKTHIKYDDFLDGLVSTEEKLLQLMDRSVAESRPLRVISSGWSSNNLITAREGALNIIMVEGLSSVCDIDAAGLKARVSGGFMISEFVERVERERLEVEWPPKGYCFTPQVSQCFGGFIATNVHHSWTDTAYRWVDAVRVAVFVERRATIVTASRTSHRELFESVFGGGGITGIIVEVELKLRRPTFYDISSVFERRYTEHETASIFKRVLREGSFVIMLPHKRLYHEKNCTPVPKGETHIETYDRKVPLWSWVTLNSLCDLLCCRFWGAYNQFVANTGFVTHFFNSVSSGTSVPQYEAFSWISGRSSQVTKEYVIEKTAAQGLTADTSMFCPLEDYDRMVGVMCKLMLEKPPPPFFVGVRYVPKGGGLIAPNASSPCVAVEFIGAGDLRENVCQGCCGRPKTMEWLERELYPAMYAAGLKLYPHLGKSNVDAPVFTETLSSEQRAAIRRLWSTYDPASIFNGGVTRFEEIYHLGPVRAAAEGGPTSERGPLLAGAGPTT